MAAALTIATGCAKVHLPALSPARPALHKINAADVHIPVAAELPPVIGYVQHHTVQPGETLLDIARDADLGFEELQSANPGVDEWIPKAGTDVLIPSRWIVPQSHYRGLVVNIAEMRLYMFPADARSGRAAHMRTWPIGIGTDHAPSPMGTFTVVSKEENPTWFVPPSIQRTMDPPQAVVPPGPDNPLGKYRLRLSKGLYEIHGTNVPWSIGRLTTHGCIRLYPEDISVLYGIVKVNTPGELLYQPVKFGALGARVFVQVHHDVYSRIHDLEHYAAVRARKLKLDGRIDTARLRDAVHEHRGVPVDITAADAA